MDCWTVIKSPVITEKSARLAGLGKYVFWVNRRANKIMIRGAIEKIYKVKVRDVRVMNVKGRFRQVRWRQRGKTPLRKKAIVTLQKGYEIKIV